MENEIDKPAHDIIKSTVELPAESLLHDLRAEKGESHGIQWLLLYEDDPMSIKPFSRLLYVKVIILTPAGRKYAQRGQAKILRQCNLRQFETAWFCRALAVAMSLWDREH